MKKAQRDRDSNSSALVHSRAEVEQLKKQLNGEGEMSYNDLLKRVNELESNTHYQRHKDARQSLSSSGGLKESTSHSSIKRAEETIAELQKIQERSVGTIHALQEENELLRLAVCSIYLFPYVKLSNLNFFMYDR